MEKGQAWILAEGPGTGTATAKEKEKEERRRVVTLDDVRAQYQAELDRMAAIESGRFAFVDVGAGDGVGERGDMDVL